MSPSVPEIVVAAYGRSMLPTAVVILEPELAVSIGVERPVTPVDSSEPVVSIMVVAIPGVPPIGAVVLVSTAVISVCCTGCGTRCDS